MSIKTLRRRSWPLALFCWLWLLAACTTPAAETAVVTPLPATATAAPPFKVVGYVTADVIVDLLPFDKLTHINYAFVIPQVDGTLNHIANGWKLESLVEQAHAHGVQVLISVGGWGHDDTFEQLAANPQARQTLIKELVALVEQYQLDGVDMDWEYPDPTADSAANFVALMQALGQEMRQRDKLLTAAVAALGYNADAITEPVFAEVDFLNLMVYDRGEGHHSPLSYAEASLAYWQGRGLPAAKTVLGVPFYSRPHYLPYKKLVDLDTQAAFQDEMAYHGAPVYYNGIPTIQQKTALALTSAAGVMIWTITDDTQDDTSLLQAVYDLVQESR